LEEKKIYIIDLARSKSRNDNELDLLAATEDLKNGLRFELEIKKANKTSFKLVILL